MRKILTYSVEELVPYISWPYFDYAWGVTNRAKDVKEQLRKDADEMLKAFNEKYHTKGLFLIDDANGDGDDLIIGTTRIPLLRQQKPAKPGDPNLCLADFVRPLSSGIKDKVGAFATTVDIRMETEYDDDPYQRMLAQTLADRLAEATAEKMHEDVRKRYWGYAPDEHLTMNELLLEKYQGIRPAVGYPSLPDASMNFILNDLIGMGDIGIRLTETGAMKPHASVSGLMFAHPRSHYFAIGKIGEDQLRDYALRRGVPVEMIRKFIK